MKILGIGGTQHDFSYCILQDGIIKVAIEEERISREKHSLGYRSRQHLGLQYCMDSVDFITDYKDFDIIVGNDAMDQNHFINPYIINNMVKINHHMAHASSVFYTSNFSEAAVLVLDGGGSFFSGYNNETCSMGYAEKNEINLFERLVGQVKEIESPRVFYTNKPYRVKFLSNAAAIPLFYMVMTEICGFRNLEEGKLMGLAPYGKDTYLGELQQYVYTDYSKSDKFHVRIDFINIFQTIEEIERCDKRDSFSITKDLAYATQAIFEDVVSKMLNYLYDKVQTKNLCYAGGAALNSVMNGKIKKRTKFEHIFVFPAAGDGGTSIGAALYGYHHILGAKKQKFTLCDVSWGKTYQEKELKESIKQYEDRITATFLEEENLYKTIAEKLSKGDVIGWFQDGAEFGPRALGNRSILADPRKEENKDRVNAKVKFREAFRPFAPVILEEKVEDYFITDFPINPFMLYVGDVRDSKKDIIPAVTHIDGTARLQTISISGNKRLYSLLKAFEDITGVPVLLNTSFNIKGKPIVETPMQAIEAFLGSDMDILVIHNAVICKH